MRFIVFTSLLLLSITQAGFLSGSKHAFKQDDILNIKVNGLHSSKTFIPYEYYHLPFPKVVSFASCHF